MKAPGKHSILILRSILISALLFVLVMLVWQRSYFSPPSPEALPAGAPVIIQGTLMQYGSNPDRDIDKMLIKAGEENYWVHFPPNAAREVLSVAPPGTLIEASVDNGKKPLPDGNVRQELLLITNMKTGKTVSVHDVPPPPPAEGKEVVISGNILDYRKDDRGDRIRGIVIRKSLIQLPPHATESLLPLLLKNKSITVKGWERNPGAGFVNEDSLTVVRPFLFTIDGVQYLVQ